jgi:hypothetical protein
MYLLTPQENDRLKHLQNKAKCEAVEDCVFSAELSYSFCNADINLCVILEPENPDYSESTCTAYGLFDWAEYKCVKEIPKEDPPNHER